MGAKKGGKERKSAAKPTQITVMPSGGGGYLVYLAFGPVGVFKTCREARWYSWAVEGFFGVIGAFLAGWSLKKFIKANILSMAKFRMMRKMIRRRISNRQLL